MASCHFESGKKRNFGLAPLAKAGSLLLGMVAFPRLHRTGLLVCGLLLLGVLSLAAQDDSPQAGTARDVIFKADAAYNQKRYPEAVQGYQRFLEDFGSSLGAEPFLAHVRYNLSASLLQVQNFEEALEVIRAAEKEEKLSSKQKENLAFWRAISLLQSESYEEARAALVGFVTKFPRSQRRQDVALLGASALLAAGQLEEAIPEFSALRQNRLSQHRPRATVLELYCLIETGQNAEALELLANEGADQDSLIQIATFQTLALGLADQLLQQDRPREAIKALQIIWPLQRLLARQEERLGAIRADLKALQGQPQPSIFRRAQLRKEEREVAKELENLKKIPSFDASVRFRLAMAFHQQERFLESALLLQDMLERLEPDPMVEKASLSALQSWLAIERYDRAVGAAETLEQRFPQSESLPLVLYLRGTAQEKAGDYEEARATFAELGQRFPQASEAPRAFFMEGFTLLLAERNDEAAEIFSAFPQKFPEHELGEAAHYWHGSALAFGQRFSEARMVLAEHSQKFPQGGLAAAAAFRYAYSAQSSQDYETAEKDLKSYLNDYPGGEEEAEARILLGDALLTQAKSEEGKKVYASVPPQSGRFHEESFFKLGKVLQMEEDDQGVRDLMRQYLTLYGPSPRAAEALFIIGKAWRREGQPEKAAEEYGKAIREFGNVAKAFAVEDMFLALGRYYKTDSEKQDYLAELRKLRKEAVKEGKEVLLVRTICALAQAVKKTDPTLSVALLREASVLADPSLINPRILADCAGAQLSAAASAENLAEVTERREKAAGLYRDLLKWHPRAAEKDKALGALARLALEDGDGQVALDYYTRLERDTPWSSLMGEALTTRAEMEVEAGQPEQASQTLLRLLAVKNVSGKLKAQALLSLGELEMGRGRPKVAIAYYQRIYILYGRWREVAAQAYLRSAEAFEEIGDREAARKTYEELAGREDLNSLPQVGQAVKKLKEFPSGEGASS